MEKERRQARECILALNETRGNGIVHHSESVDYKRQGIDQRA